MTNYFYIKYSRNFIENFKLEINELKRTITK